MNTEQERVWAGEFGDEYTVRNRVDWWARVPFWAKILTITNPASAFELGCNAGWNLLAMRATGFPVQAGGCDVNATAIAQARAFGLWAVFAGSLLPARNVGNLEDLVFTAGVLIHVHPTHLLDTMHALAKRARRHVLAIEYESTGEETLEYRGRPGLLWKRPYGQLYQAMGLKLLERFENPVGFDRCTAWLLAK